GATGIAGATGATGALAAFTTAGAALPASHSVVGTGTAVGGVLAITLSGSAVFSSNTSYVCSGTDTTTPVFPVGFTYTSGTAFTVNTVGAADSFRFICI